MHAMTKLVTTFALAAALGLTGTAALAASPAPEKAPAPAPSPALAAQSAQPAMPAKASNPMRQYLSQLPEADQAAAKAIMAKRAPQRKALRAQLKTVAKDMRELWKQEKFDQAKFTAKGKELNEVINKLGLLRLEEMTELRARFGPQLPLPKRGH